MGALHMSHVVLDCFVVLKAFRNVDCKQIHSLGQHGGKAELLRINFKFDRNIESEHFNIGDN